MEVSDQKSDILPHWMAAHACLKNEFTEDEKYHNLMSWLKYNIEELLLFIPIHALSLIKALHTFSSEKYSQMSLKCTKFPVLAHILS